MTDVTIIHQDAELDADKLIFEGINTDHKPECQFSVKPCNPEKCKGPRFTVSEVSKFFFGQSPHWIRWRENKGFFVFEGEKVGTTRTEAKLGYGARTYNLADIEKVIHALAGHGALEASQMSNALQTLQIQGRIWKYLE